MLLWNVLLPNNAFIALITFLFCLYTNPGSFPGEGKAARVWNWQFTFIWCWSQECVELYLHSPIQLHGVGAQLNHRGNFTCTCLLIQKLLMYGLEIQIGIFLHMKFLWSTWVWRLYSVLAVWYEIVYVRFSASHYTFWKAFHVNLSLQMLQFWHWTPQNPSSTLIEITAVHEQCNGDSHHLSCF
jgi:hypothetical protein